MPLRLRDHRCSRLPVLSHGSALGLPGGVLPAFPIGVNAFPPSLPNAATTRAVVHEYAQRTVSDANAHECGRPMFSPCAARRWTSLNCSTVPRACHRCRPAVRTASSGGNRVGYACIATQSCSRTPHHDVEARADRAATLKYAWASCPLQVAHGRALTAEPPAPAIGNRRYSRRASGSHAAPARTVRSPTIRGHQRPARKAVPARTAWSCRWPFCSYQTSTFAPSCATRSMANSWTAPHSARASRYEPPGPCSRCAADRDSLQWRATLKAWGARPGLALFSSKPGTSVATPTPSCRARRAATLWFPASRLVAAGALNPQPSCGCLHKRAASAHAAVRYALRTACVSRWGGIIAAAAQRALASSLEHEVLQDARWLDAPVSNRPPART